MEDIDDLLESSGDEKVSEKEHKKNKIKFECKICLKKFGKKKKKKDFDKHLDLDHKFPCRKCFLKFPFRNVLDIHMMECHLVDNTVSFFKCKFCQGRVKINVFSFSPHRKLFNSVSCIFLNSENFFSPKSLYFKMK